MRTFSFRAAKELQGHRCADHLAEARGQDLHLRPLALARATRRLADEHEQEGRDGECRKKEQCRERIEDGADCEDEGHEHGERYGRRNDGMKPRLECVHAF